MICVKINVFKVKTVKNLVRFIANDNVFLENWLEVNEILVCFHYNPVVYIDFKHFCDNLINYY